MTNAVRPALSRWAGSDGASGDRGLDGGEDRLHMAVVDGTKQFLAAGELLIEVPGIEAGLRAQRLDRHRRKALGPEQLEAGVEQLLPALGPALGRRLATVAAFAGDRGHLERQLDRSRSRWW